MDAILAGVSLGTVAAGVTTLLLAVIGLRLLFKGTDVSKRVISKV